MTSEYRMNHTMMRIKDPKETLAFYEKHFGMQLVKKLAIPQLGFDNYFLAFTGDQTVHKSLPWYEREGLLELCHNHGSEKDPNFKVNNGNEEPHRGFGHICFSVDDIGAACDKLEVAGVKFKKRLSDGRQKDIAFALDPNGYWIELIQNRTLSPKGSGTYNMATTRFNHSMIRVRDPEQSVQFYRDLLGMSLLRMARFEEAKFTLYFLGYNHQDPNFVEGSGEGVSNREGIIELTHNWGTESDPEFTTYHNGNDEPQGFGHFGITVPDVDEAINRLENLGVPIKKRKTDGKMKFIGFVIDPDGYWIELLPKADITDDMLSF
ncbi:glyoxalase I [Trichomonascus vanleenenianus]|uniref:lactoylglutathione lyase GLO1 n=1 Tax=Trichomonascus vanleenenianus TaxID=2268995 RepID=UPI003ECBAEF9